MKVDNNAFASLVGLTAMIMIISWRLLTLSYISECHDIYS